ncbi:MAG: hypothetical protein HZA77_13085 [Candidatus Schekmanbacteria bacterium]|nr:hypothetical protein [Candidatus Schekmanbacteria bacterium]
MRFFSATEIIFRLKLVFLLLSILQFNACNSSNDTGINSSQTEAFTVIADSHVDRTKIHPGEEIRFEIESEYSSGTIIKFPDISKDISGFGILDSGEINTKLPAGATKLSKWYSLSAGGAGSYLLPEVSVTYIAVDGKTGEIKTPAILVEVIPGSQPITADNIKDIKPLEEINGSGNFIWYAAAALIVIAIMIISVFIFFRSRKEPVTEMPAVYRPDKGALSSYKALKDKRLIEKGRVKEFYFELSAIFKRYLSERFGIKTAECTTEEIIPLLNRIKDLHSDSFHSGKSFLVETDMIKYTSLGATEELCRTIEGLFVKFIEETRNETEGDELGRA